MPSAKDILGKSYGAKLATGEWKDFSSRIRKERGGACEYCRRADVVTQVHHVCYEQGKEPWDSEHGDVMLLCVSCHAIMHAELTNFRKFVFGFFTPQSFPRFNRALMVALHRYDPLLFSSAFAEFVGNENLVNNHAKAIGFNSAQSTNPKVESLMLRMNRNRREEIRSGRINDHLNAPLIDHDEEARRCGPRSKPINVNFQT